MPLLRFARKNLLNPAALPLTPSRLKPVLLKAARAASVAVRIAFDVSGGAHTL
jgi:hypothetical protein